MTHDEEIQRQSAINQEKKSQRQRALRPWMERLKLIKREHKAAHSSLRALSDERMELMRERMRLDGLRREYREQPSVIEARAALLIEIEELDRAIEPARAIWEPQCALVTACEEWLEKNTARIVSDYRPDEEHHNEVEQ